ncbi:MAG: aminotransferase class I/II-fold pyridoxal phosphate-dependent enzyme [bacterium]|nr:aminotransferase class I/II-fold pyridoxal phosphate-dependent enzyme [bacterium]
MPLNKLEKALTKKLSELNEKGTLKGKETVITRVKPAQGPRGPRYLLERYGEKEFIRMNSNSYLGLSLQREVIDAEEKSAKRFGAGPAAVRFISGTYFPHVELERKLAIFHKREAAMLFSSAYAAVMGTLFALIDNETIIINDELNHNCIINAARLARPKGKEIYKHLDMEDLENKIKQSIGKANRIIIATDGVFSMRGDCAPLNLIAPMAEKYNDEFEDGVILVVDDSHGVGGFGKTGRGTEEHTKARGVDIIIATLGKALGVNGGYITASSKIIEYLRESAPLYIYSNSITPPEASAAMKALDILDSTRGKELLEKMRRLITLFEQGVINLEYEIIKSEHPVVPLMLRDTEKTTKLVNFLLENGILATGVKFPVVPKGDEEIRFQVTADHTEYDINYVLGVLKKFKNSQI